MKHDFSNLRCIGLLCILLQAGTVFGQGQPFKIVIDAGHGGKDPGNLGTGRYKRTEKDVVLRVALKLGGLIERNMRDVQVIYTRKADRFVTLKDRSRMANREKANLFVSIHCNSARSHEPHGSETYVMGLNKAEANFEIAKRENSVIYLEDDYHKTYEGFDPGSPDSYIGLNLVQNQNLAQSLKFAGYVEEAFRVAPKRGDRGVKQAGFWVISKNIMPSVLVELGFLTNKREERYLNTTSGQNQMALALYRAFKRYKAGIDTFKAAALKARKTLGKAPHGTAPTALKGITYGVQLYAARNPASASPKAFKGLHPIRTYRDKAYTRYVYGVAQRPRQAYALLKEALQSGFKQAFLVAYKEGKAYARYYDNVLPVALKPHGKGALGKQVPKDQSAVVFKVQFYSSATLLQAEKRFQKVRDVSHYAYQGSYAYTSGCFSSYDQALKRLHKLREKGYDDAFLIAFQRGRRISLNLARKLTENR